MYNELELDIALESLDEIIDNDISFNTEDAEKVFMECINKRKSSADDFEK